MSAKTSPHWIALVAAVICGCCFAAEPMKQLMATIVADVPLPGDASRFDYESLDPERHLLFIAHLGASEVLVFDTQTRKVVAQIRDLSRVHGVLAIPALHRVYASATGTDEVVTIDEDTLEITIRIPGGRYPDGMAYAPDVHKLFVSDETGKTETVIDVRTNRRVATVELGGEVGNTQYDSASKHIFVNVQSRNDLVEIDPVTDHIVRRIPLPGAAGNHGLLIDAIQRRAFIACEDNDKLLVLNLKTRTVESSFELGHGPDVLSEDAALDRVYVASESGIVSVFGLSDGKVVKLREGFVGANAHVVAVDATRNEAYFPVKSGPSGPVLRIIRLVR